MSPKASSLLAAILADLPPSDPLAKRLHKVAEAVQELETHCAELAVDSQKMAREMIALRIDVGILRDRLKVSGQPKR